MGVHDRVCDGLGIGGEGDRASSGLIVAISEIPI
jgi:hypothetical protein